VIVAEVTDDGAGGARPYVHDDDADGLRGRGMRIIDALALGWGLRPDGDRTTVWMRFPGPGGRMSSGVKARGPQLRRR
jgi:hypothetical protein